MKRLFLLLVLTAVLGLSAWAQRREYTPTPVKGNAWNTPGSINPILPGYFADPTIKKFGDTYYIYATTDGTGNGYGPAQVWMSKDFVNWRNCVMNWPTTEVVWAPDVVQQPDGKYRYYYCEPCVVSVGESDSPVGPWTNILGKEDAVLVPDRYIHNVITLDPMLFNDEDGSQYLYFTTWGIYNGFGCGVAKLNDGAYSLDDLKKYSEARYWNENAPYEIAADKYFSDKRLIPNTEIKDVFEAPFVFKRDGIYYFTYSSGSCHTDTYRVQYATSTEGPMGPYTYKGELLTTNEDGTVHGPGHHSVLEQDGEYYIVYHRHNIAKSVHGFNRQVCIDKMEFAPNGDILRIVPTHDGVNPLSEKMQKRAARYKDLALGAKVTASSYYSEEFKPAYAVDNNNATLWKAAHTNWDNNTAGTPNKEWIQIDLGKVQKFNEVWTQFEYPTFFYQYKIETSVDGQSWTLFADRTKNVEEGSPMIDICMVKARYVRLTITDTQKNGHMPAVWNIKVWDKAPTLPSLPSQTNDSYPGMHEKDVKENERGTNCFELNANIYAPQGQAQDVTSVTAQSDYSLGDMPLTFRANKPIHVRVKDGKWAWFFNGTQTLTSEASLPRSFAYNSPYTLSAWVLTTKTGAVATVASLSSSRADLANTELRMGSDPSTGLVNHNGSFESMGAPREIAAAEGKWHMWTLTYDGWMERAYMDGQLVKEHNNFLMIKPEGHITIGADASGSNNFMGYVASLRFEPKSMTEAQVKALYKATATFEAPSLGDDDFEEIDPDSKFTLNPDFRLLYEQKEEMRMSTTSADFNDNPLANGGKMLTDVQGDWVVQCEVTDMEGLRAHNVKAYNEGGLLVKDGETYYQYGAFPLYNCGNMLTVLSRRGRPQYPNYKGYEFDRFMQFERRGNQLFARHSADGKTWTNSPGSPITVRNDKMQVGVYQTTYSETPSWVKIERFKVWGK